MTIHMPQDKQKGFITTSRTEKKTNGTFMSAKRVYIDVDGRYDKEREKKRERKKREREKFLVLY